MSDVFLSYAHEDHVAAASLAQRLQQRGWSVFWDRTSLFPGQEFARVIEDELAQAACVVVLWSGSSAAARWVRAEAHAGMERDVAVPVLLEKVELPLLFRNVLAADLTGWDGESDHPGLARLLVAVERRIAAAGSAGSGTTLAPALQPSPLQPGPAVGAGRAGDARRRGSVQRLSQATMVLIVAGSVFALTVAALAAWRWGPWTDEGAGPGPSRVGEPSPSPGIPGGSGRAFGTGADPRSAKGDVFTLEVLDAGNGECYVLHHGPASAPSFSLLDGGNISTYRAALRPRLEGLRRTWSRGRSLPLELVAVSQISDHRIAGILHLFRDLRAARQQGLEPLLAIERLWFNGFELPMVAPSFLPGGVSGAAAVPAVHRSDSIARRRAGGLRLASVRQAQTLLSDARYLGLPVNQPFDRLVMRPEHGVVRLTLGGDLAVTVLGPSREHVLDLFDHWLDYLSEKRQVSPEEAARLRSRRDEWTAETFSDPLLGRSVSRRDSPPVPRRLSAPSSVVPVAYVDESVPNLASIVLLLEKHGKRMLLTGDARGDHVLAGLRAAGLLPTGGTVHVEVLQVPHQGSDRSVGQDFFEAVLADAYVINGNGSHGNPEIATLQMITRARGDAEYSLYFTHPDGEDELRSRLESFFDTERSLGRRYEVHFRARDSSSMRINLLAPVDY